MKIITEAEIKHAKAINAIAFFINCTDEQYAAWWPGAHIGFHTLKQTPDVVGSLVFFDEYVGVRRLKFQSRITQYDPRGVVEYQMIRWGIRLPGWLNLEFRQEGARVAVTHTLKIGFVGWLSVLDCIIRPFIPKKFINDLEQHAQEEFSRLSGLI